MKDFSDYISNLPKVPGIYQFYDRDNTILYIGKAKNLHARVGSYFVESNRSFKNSVLTKQIFSIKFTVVESEEDALLLENNLIKEYQPKYNVLLKDDKTFPWICIKNENFPRIFITRNRVNDGSVYYGPYTSAVMIRTLLELIKALYPLRTCKHLLNQKNIEEKKFKPCLEYHLGNCLAPCDGLQNEESYHENITHIKEILKGNINEVINLLNERMQSFAEKLQFEEAEKTKQKLDMLLRYKAKSTIVSTSLTNLDVFGYVEEGKSFYFNYLKVINGSIVQSLSVELIRKIDEELEDIISFAIVDIREKVNSTSKIALVPLLIQGFSSLNLIVPQKGDKRKLLDLALRNANNYRIQKQKVREELKSKKGNSEVLANLKIDLRLKELPVHIECFDNSNIQGTNPVAACVVFKNAKPAKSEYRHFHIKSVTGANDFASMEEIIYRRYKRLLEENSGLPQLIVIDGGKGQLSSAVKSLKKLDLYDKISIIGIAKRLEEIYFPNDSIPLYIDKNSSSLKIIQHLRNEAHRFGISFHRKLREKNQITSELEQIKGIGPATIKKLLSEFKSVEIIKTKSKDELEPVIGKANADKIVNYFKDL